MEKLKAKHDHKLTDILKVAIFGLMLILPGLILLPSMLYYGVNEHATAPTKQVEKIEYERVNFNQLIKNGNFTNSTEWYLLYDDYATISINNGACIEVIDEGSQTNWQYSLSQHLGNELNIGDKYLLSCDISTTSNTSYMYFEIGGANSMTINYGMKSMAITTILNVYNDTFIIYPSSSPSVNDTFTFKNINLFNLTQMFGAGNEPTIEEFSSWYTEEYYEYTESRYEILEIPTGTYETYTDITSQIQFNWNSLWQQPLFNWTNYTILKQGLDNFTYVFGITQTSYINNLITYELIMVAIYIVIDIVLTLFKWLTHLIGEK